jgi:hypothetical protein
MSLDVDAAGPEVISAIDQPDNQGERLIIQSTNASAPSGDLGSSLS